jgi:hypothetical protein
MIAPSVIKFFTDRFICGNTFRSVWALREYPTYRGTGHLAASWRKDANYIDLPGKPDLFFIKAQVAQLSLYLIGLLIR